MEEDLDYPLELFVEKVDLPHRAKVTEGYYEAGDEDGDREFSNGEILQVRRLICPFVDLNFTHPVTDRDSRITISTRNQNVRFRVITEMEALALTKPRTFNNVREMIEKWPTSIKSLADQFVEVPGSVPYAIVRGDELRLIRVISDANPAAVRLELKSKSTKQLLQLPVGFTGSFCELEDPKSYSLQELVDLARVERYLRLDLCEKATQVRGLPKDFEGVLKMKRPQLLVEIARVLVRETNDEEYTGQPLLCPIDCDIKLTPRDASYMPIPYESHPLSALGKDHANMRLPFIARIVGWTEETGILQNQMTKPGDHLVLYCRTSVDKILAHCGKNYFLIPSYHKGCFKRVKDGKTELQTEEVKLGSLETETFPFGVEYFNTSEYRNTSDDQLPSNEELTFDRFVKAEPCLVVSKLFGDAIGAGFHLPLRTKIKIRMERRWKRATTAPQQMSHLDACSESITEGLYHELMGTNEYASSPGTDGKLVKKGSPGRLPPVPPPRPGQPNAALANRPQPPLPPTANINRPVNRRRNKYEEDGESSDDDYSYIDVQPLSLSRPESATEEEINKGIIEIPVNGNISGFNTYQMVFFLRENHAPTQTLSKWRRQKFDGMAFAKMSDDDLKTHGIANPVVQFFRDRSKMQLVLAHL